MLTLSTLYRSLLLQMALVRARHPHRCRRLPNWRLVRIATKWSRSQWPAVEIVPLQYIQVGQMAAKTVWFPAVLTISLLHERLLWRPQGRNYGHVALRSLRQREDAGGFSRE